MRLIYFKQSCIEKYIHRVSLKKNDLVKAAYFVLLLNRTIKQLNNHTIKQSNNQRNKETIELLNNQVSKYSNNQKIK